MSFWRVDWKGTANNFEGRQHRFLHASRRMNILSNDMLRYIDVCESLVNIAKEGQTIQLEYDSALMELSQTKEKPKRTILWRKLRHLHERLAHIHKSMVIKKKHLVKIHKDYEDNLKEFSKALK